MDEQLGRPVYTVDPLATGFVPTAEQFDAMGWAQGFFGWYNHEHHTWGWATDAGSVQYGQASSVLAERQRVLATAYAAHPERFVKRPPTPPALSKEVWINRPQPVLELLGLAH